MAGLFVEDAEVMHARGHLEDEEVFAASGQFVAAGAVKMIGSLGEIAGRDAEHEGEVFVFDRFFGSESVQADR